MDKTQFCHKNFEVLTSRMGNKRKPFLNMTATKISILIEERLNGRHPQLLVAQWSTGPGSNPGGHIGVNYYKGESMEIVFI